MRKLYSVVLITALIKISYSQPTIALQQYLTGFSRPVDIANCGDERLFIVEQSGYIRIVNAQGTVNSTAFLDIDSRVQCCGEEGLLGLAFHPDYKNNGYFFVYYTNNNGNQVISRFSVSAGNPDIADAASEANVITIPHPGYSNHNGGNLDFGPDGYLYIGTGDGGGGGDPDDNAQDPLSLLGKMLRLDVDTLPYLFPPDNPFIGFASVRNEIWALGLRNPWRFSFDRLTDDLWIGDVGQNAREEVNFQAASSTGGENYGWRCYEGNNTYNTSGCGAASNYVFPVYDYNNNSIGCTMVGGYVYRGCKYPNLFGNYIFCDYCSGRFWTTNASTFQTTAQLQSSTFQYVAFGEDMNGEIYVAGLNGIIYRVTETTVGTLPTISANTSTTFCPGDSVVLSTQAGFSSYDWKFNDENSLGTGLQINAKTPGKYTLTTTSNNGCIYTTPGTTVTTLTPPSPVITAPFTSFCDGDSSQLLTGNFNNYIWSNGATTWTTFAMETDNYTVTVTDAFGCTGSSSPFSITENPLPQPAIQQNGFLCGGNSATLSTVDAFTSYSWSSGETVEQISISQAGNYQVSVVDANGCTGTESYDVVNNQLPPPVIASASGSIICGNDSIELSSSMTDVFFLWSTGDTAASTIVNQAGNYFLTVTDSSGCIGVSDAFELTTLPNPAAPVIMPAAAEACEEDIVELGTVLGYSSYAWSRDEGDTMPLLFVTKSGMFNVTVTDANGCEAVSDSVEVVFHPNPLKPSIIETIDYPELTASVSGYTYQWYLNGNSIPNATSQSIIYTDYAAEGEFAVLITDSNGCSSLSDALNVSWTGIEEPWLGNFTIQPNPFNSEIVLKYNLQDRTDLQIRLLDISGKELAMLMKAKKDTGNHILSINSTKYNLSSGIYFLEMTNGKLSRIFKLVKL